MNEPWWQYLAISEDAAYVLPEKERLISFIIMAAGLVIITPQFIYSMIKIRSQKGVSGSKVVKHYSYLFFGLYFTYLNSFILRLSIFLTEGEFSVFGQEKGVLFVTGIVFYCMGTIGVALDIINFRKRTVKIIRIIFYLFMIISFVVLIMQTTIIFGYEDIIEITVLITAVAAIIGSCFLFVFVISFLFEMKNDPSKIEKLRLALLSGGFFLMILELIAIGLGSAAKRFDNSELFISTSTYTIPIVYFIAQPIMYLLLIWAIFPTNWLLIKTKVIQPSFKALLNKK